MSFRIFPFSDLVWMYIKAIVSALARRLLAVLYGHASVLQFDLAGHLGDVKSMIHTQNRNSQRKEKLFSWNKQAGAQSKTDKQPSTTDIFQICSATNHNSAETALVGLCRAHKNTGHSRWWRRSHRGRVHALLTPSTPYMRAQPLWMFKYVTESVHNLGRTHYLMSISILFHQIPSTGMGFVKMPERS